MLSGSRGAKYGLQLPGARRGGDSKASGLKSLQAKKPSIFSEDSDEENVESEIARQAAKKRSDKEMEQQRAAALKEDPNIFDYDGVYDEMKQAKAKPAEQQQAQRQPRYIAGLLKKAKEREKAQEMVMERKIHKEQAVEAHLFGDKEKFVTGAYKRKLAEDAKWREEERRREELEKANEVTKKSDLSDFYRNLLNKNEAFGGGDRAVSAPSPQNEEAARALEAGQGEGGAPLIEASRGPEAHAAAASLSLEDGRSSEDGRHLSEPGNLPVPENVHGGQDQIDGNSDQEQGADRAEDTLEKGQKAKDRSKDAGERKDASDRKGPITNGGSKVDGVSAAKARYLARKKQKT